MEGKKRKSSDRNPGSILPYYSRYGNAGKTSKTTSTVAILWPFKASFEDSAATVEADTFVFPALGGPRVPSLGSESKTQKKKHVPSSTQIVPFGSKQKRPGAKGPPEFVPESPLQKGSLGVVFSPRNQRENVHAKSANFEGRRSGGHLLGRPLLFTSEPY